MMILISQNSCDVIDLTGKRVYCHGNKIGVDDLSNSKEIERGQLSLDLFK